MDHRGTIFMLRIVAFIVIATALGTFVAHLRSTPDLNGSAVLMLLALLVFGIGLGAILLGIAAVLKQRPKAPADASSSSLAQSQLVELAMKVEDLATSIERLIFLRAETQSSPSDTAPSEEADGDSPEMLAAMQKMFEELRYLSQLPEEQRRQRWLEQQEDRRESAIRAAAAFVQSRQWASAQKAINELENESPSDPAVMAVRKELELARAGAEKQAIEIAQAQIESAMSLSQWEQAVALAGKLAGDFPNSAKAAKMLQRVEREREIYTEATVQRLYDDIRHAVERRIWRRALEHAQTLLETFPDHARSELIRKQIKTIGDNAEIEERQEQEVRIGELIRARRFREAVELSEELLVRFPTSPQAVAIEKMLPKIQQLAAEAESKAAESSSA